MLYHDDKMCSSKFFSQKALYILIFSASTAWDTDMMLIIKLMNAQMEQILCPLTYLLVERASFGQIVQEDGYKIT